MRIRRPRLSGPAFACFTTLSLVAHAAAQTQQVHTNFSTHDFNSRVPLAGEAAALHTTWTDVKTPGDGRTYAVGSVVVRTTQSNNGAAFSGFGNVRVPQYPIAPNTPTGFTTPTPGASRQVIMLQCSGVDPNAAAAPNPEQRVLWQHYWYGDSLMNGIPPDAWVRRANNARAISVWPVTTDNGQLDPARTRIAIGGETFDMLMQGNQWNGAQGWNAIVSQSPVISPLGTNGLANGFVAVFDGNGNFLWSHQFYFEQSIGHSAITDLSIRVVENADGARDVVTYCGISSFGLPNTLQDGDNRLSARNAFKAPPVTAQNPLPSAGDTDHGPAQWDGFVGRLSNVHFMPTGGSTTREFHSIVGGEEEDGLWGLAEIDANRFVVVGGSSQDSTAQQPGDRTFPYTNTGVAWGAGTFDVGVVAYFDASPVASGGRLVLEKAEPLTSPAGGGQTIARDVYVSRSDQQFGERVCIVGASVDAGLMQLASIPVVGTFTPMVVNGFLLQAIADPNPFVIWTGGAWLDNLGACGVAGHPDHRDHLVVLGGQGQPRLTSFFNDTTPTGVGLLQLRDDVVVSTAPSFPAAVGAVNAVSSTRGLAYGRRGGIDNALAVSALFVGPQNGGGLAVDPRGRVTMAGLSRAVGYPVVPPLPGPTLARPYTNFGFGTLANGIRTVVDMLPIRAGGGVGRSDGTGSPVGTAALFPLAGRSGGTTPLCALSAFGRRIGQPVAPQDRMLIDVEGPLAPGANLNVLIDRTPPTTTFNLVAFQFGFPNAAPVLVLPEGLEIYATNAPALATYPWAAGQPPLVPGESLRFPLPPLPNTSITLSVQALFFLSGTVPGGVPGVCNVPSTGVATPALWVSL